MAVAVANRLDAENEKRMRDFAATLSEKDRRRFAAFEAKQQGYGGIEYIAGVIGCSRRTIERGIKELDDLEQDPAAGQVRRPGAGRKKR
jgi:transcriptional antiterminator